MDGASIERESGITYSARESPSGGFDGSHQQSQDRILGRTMTPAIDSAIVMERQLTNHFLRAGEEGYLDPIGHIDARESILNVVLDVPSGSLDLLTESCRPLGTFRNLFEQGDTQVLPKIEGCPGYLRFLILSCAIVVNEDRWGSGRDFRKNLAQVVGFEIQRLDGLSRAWEALERWCAKEFERGADVRLLRLPDPGRQVQIGYTNYLAFPSWRDARKLEQVVRVGSRSADPLNAIAQKVRDDERLSQSVRYAATEYLSSIGLWTNNLESDHSFVQLIRQVMLEFERGTPSGAIHWLRLDIDAEIDEVSASIVANIDGKGEEEIEYGEVASLLEQVSRRSSAYRFPLELLRGANSGIVPVVALGFGSYSSQVDESSEHYFVVNADKRSLLSEVFEFEQSDFRQLDDRWSLLRKPASQEQVGVLKKYWSNDDLSKLGRLVTRRRLLVGGHCVAPGIFLGRAGSLPRLNIDGECRVTLQATNGNSGQHWQFDTSDGSLLVSDVLDGAYRLELAISAKPVQAEPLRRQVRFSQEAHWAARLSEPEPSRYASFAPLRCSKDKLETVGLVDAQETNIHPRSADLETLLEILQTRAQHKHGWAAAQLIEVICDVFQCHSAFAWPIIRLLEIESWLQPVRSLSWSTRRWFLVTPYLQIIGSGSDQVLLTGSTSLGLKRIFTESCRHLGYEHGRRAHVGDVSPMRLWARGCDPGELADRIGIALRVPEVHSLSSAPDCWVDDARVSSRHEVDLVWSWPRQCFEKKIDDRDEPVGISRYIDSSGRLPVVYRVDDCGSNGGQRLFHDRHAALCEAYRLAQRSYLSLDGIRMSGSFPAAMLPHIVGSHLSWIEGIGCGLNLTSSSACVVEYPVSPAVIHYLRDMYGAGFLSGVGDQTKNSLWKCVVERKLGVFASPALASIHRLTSTRGPFTN